MLDEVKAKIKQGQTTEARQLLKQHLRSNPEDAEAWFLAARVSSTKEQAISCLKKAIDLDPFNDLAVNQLNRLTSESTVASQPKHKNQSAKDVTVNPLYIGGGVIVVLLVGLIGGILLSGANNNADPVLPTTIVNDAQDNPNDIASIQQPTNTPESVPTDTSEPVQPTLPPTWTLTPTKHVTATPRATRDTRGTRDNPFPVSDEYVYRIRGTDGMIAVGNVEYDAWNIVESINMFNEEPSYNQQWVLIGIVYKCDAPSSQTCEVLDSDFELLGSDGTLYEPPFATVLDDLELQSTVFGGETVSGYIGFIVDRYDSNFILIAKPNMFSDERTFFRTE